MPLTVTGPCPRRAPSAAAATVALLACVSGACGTSPERARAEELFAGFERRELVLGAWDSSLDSYRRTLEATAEVRELVSLGRPAAGVAADRLGDPAVREDDDTLSVALYVLERSGDAGAIPQVEAFLYGNPGDRDLVWSPHFAVRTLLVLRGLDDPSGGFALYDDRDFLRALGQPAR